MTKKPQPKPKSSSSRKIRPAPGCGQAVRVFAYGKEDKQTKFVVIANLGEDNRINPDFESYGYIVDLLKETDSWITSVFQLTYHNGNGRMFYGDEASDPTFTNIYAKPILIGELFTVHYSENSEDDGVFQINTVTVY